jgi:neutral ceramidase
MTALCRFALVVGVVLLGGTRFAPAQEPAAPAASPFKAGFAERDITPEPGMEVPGGYGKARHGDKRHSPCMVRAVVFDDGKTRVAVVGVDALGVRRDTVEAARKAIEQRCGIAPGNVMISASHSHSAGPALGPIPGDWPEASDLLKKLIFEMSTNADEKYLAKLQQAIIDSVVEADGKRVEARAAAGFGVAEGVAFNRRFRMKDGRSATHPGQGNPDIIEPAGPVDPQVGVIGAWDAEGKLLGCVVNFACHATTGPGGISADYIYYIEQTVRGLMGDHAVVVFVPGMAGDVTQVDNRSPYAVPQFGVDASRLLGGKVGTAALEFLLSARSGAGPLMPTAAQSTMLNIKRRVPRPERVAKSLELVQKAPGSPGVDPTEWTFAKEIVILDAIVKKEPVKEFEVQAIQVGPAVFLSCPAEYFVQYGLDLKAGSKFPVTFPVSLANDCIGYVPTEEALSPTGGGYETRLTSYSNLEPTAGSQIRDALLALAHKLTPGAAPQPPKLPETKATTWSYGAVPPELD